MKTKWDDIKEAPLLNKIAMLIDVALNPHASDWPVALDKNGTEIIFIRWVKRK